MCIFFHALKRPLVIRFFICFPFHSRPVSQRRFTGRPDKLYSVSGVGSVCPAQIGFLSVLNCFRFELDKDITKIIKTLKMPNFWALVPVLINTIFYMFVVKKKARVLTAAGCKILYIVSYIILFFIHSINPPFNRTILVSCFCVIGLKFLSKSCYPFIFRKNFFI